ncbi:DUF5313 family protein [Pseudonocardia sp. ICBG1142]|uniref:DUF5313 family protein n=1 Tax=Pseudonocardia sp. ICBG1142 TaxID=2846760 RepID=UPI001CF6B15B|nr:DUF5313 family protein [Pseudonocardia sp. ICBG1142]
MIRRPDPLRWLWYAAGGRLPPRYREWVLHDTTCRTWHLRHFARTAAVLTLLSVPLALVIPGPLWLRLSALLLGWLVSLQYALFVMEESVEHRVVKAGYPAGTARATRLEATADERAEATRRYAERYRGAPPP